MTGPRRTYVALAVAGLVVAALLWVVADFLLCGVSGCSGGGFGRSYAPRAVQATLLLSGIAAAAAPAAAGRSGGSRRLLGVAVILFVAVAVVGGIVIGAGVDGYPRSVPRATIEQERQ